MSWSIPGFDHGTVHRLKTPVLSASCLPAGQGVGGQPHVFASTKLFGQTQRQAALLVRATPDSGVKESDGYSQTN